MIICDSCKNKAYGALTLNVMGVARTVDICIPCLENICNTLGIDKKGFVPTAKETITQDAATRKGAVNVHDGSDAAYVELGTSCTTLELPPDFPTVKIGNQVWMAKNLDIDDGGEGIYHNQENGETYYTWEAAVRVCGKLKGWHLPSDAEWETLFTAVGGQGDAGKVLKAQTGWYSNGNGTDAYGFSALPASYRYNTGDFYSAGYRAYFWSATEGDSYFADYVRLDYDYDYAHLYNIFKIYGFSVRCLQDKE